MIMPLNSLRATAYITEDTDNYGIYSSRDVDNTAESYVDINFQDDCANKKLYISSSDLDESSYSANRIYITIYGLRTGNIYTGPTHAINLNTHQIKTFQASQYFSNTYYSWVVFQFDASAIRSYIYTNSLNSITITKLSGPDWTYENLRIGVDRTFLPAGAGMQDFQRSDFISDSSCPGVSNSNGELMIYMEHADRVVSFTYNGKNSQVLLDGYDDKIEKRFYISSSSSTFGFVRLWIYGRSAGTNSGTSAMRLTVYSDSNPTGWTLLFNPYVKWSYQVWTWNYLDIPLSALTYNSYNYFKLDDPTSSFTQDNLYIGLDTTIINSDQSRWYWYDGSWHGTWNYATDQGELDMNLEIYYRETVSNEVGVTSIQDSNCNTFLDAADATLLYNDLGDKYGYSKRFNTQDSNLDEGRIYMSRYHSSGSGYDGNDVDFLMFSGHGGAQVVALQYCSSPNVENPTDKNWMELNSPSGAGWEGDVSSDGFDRDTEWVLFSSCEVLDDVGGSNANSQTNALLFHNLHKILGYYGEVYKCTGGNCGSNHGESYNIIGGFTSRVGSGNKEQINDAWFNANNEFAINTWGWTVWGKGENSGDHIWGKGIVGEDSYNKDIYYWT